MIYKLLTAFRFASTCALLLALLLAAPALAQPSPVGVLYVKFVADTVTEFRLLSFKEKDNG